MELRQLRYFTVICEAGSLTAAGARLHIAQQSLSATVASLEGELGVRLLDRGSFGVRATVAGQVLCEKATALLHDADVASRAVQEAAELGSGEVRMRYGLDSEHVVGELLDRVRRGLPYLAVTGWTGSDSDNLRALRAGDTDLVVAWAVDGHVADLHTATLAHERCWAAVPQDHPLAGLPAIPVEALAGGPLVMFPRGSAPLVWEYIARHLTADPRLPPQITQTAASGQGGLIDAAVRTTAVAPVSHSLIPSLGRPGVRFVPFEPALDVAAHLVWRPRPSPAAARIVAALTPGQGSPTP